MDDVSLIGVFSSFSMVGASALVAAAVRRASRRVGFFMRAFCADPYTDMVSEPKPAIFVL
jgi:hypothetical protein